MMSREEISSRTRTLVDVAMGRKKADLVVKNGQWVLKTVFEPG